MEYNGWYAPMQRLRRTLMASIVDSMKTIEEADALGKGLVDYRKIYPVRIKGVYLSAPDLKDCELASAEIRWISIRDGIMYSTTGFRYEIAKCGTDILYQIAGHLENRANGVRAEARKRKIYSIF